MRISDWSSDVCSSDLRAEEAPMEPQAIERRLTTIVSADVAGYSRLMGEDEAATLAALKAHRKSLIDPKVEQYHGRTIKLMGDGALMEFASVVDAVTFAVDVQCSMLERNAEVPTERRIAYRSEEHTSELQSLMRISYAVSCLKKKNT